MDKDLDPDVKEVLEKIGAQVKKMRKANSTLDYQKFAKKELPIGTIKYYRIERGYGDYHISNLLKVLRHYPDLKISDFFNAAGL